MLKFDYTFRQFLLEADLFHTPESHVPYLLDPGVYDLLAFLNRLRWKHVRGLIDANGFTYWWDSAPFSLKLRSSTCRFR